MPSERVSLSAETGMEGKNITGRAINEIKKTRRKWVILNIPYGSKILKMYTGERGFVKQRCDTIMGQTAVIFANGR